MRRGTARLAALAPGVLAVGLAAFAGHLASGIGGAREGGETISAGGARLVAPEGWRVERNAPGVGGLELEHAVAARAPDGDGLALVGMLPEVLFARELAAAAPDAVRLGELEAYRWRGDPTLLAAPTGMGVAVVSCSGPARAVKRCERAAATLQVPGAKPTSLDTLGFYAGHLHAAIDRLERRHRVAAVRLRTARTRTEQAAAAMRARGAYGSAARSLSDLAPPAAAVRANEALVDTLGDIGAAYAELARAARLGRRPAYEAATRSVERHEAALRDTLGRMAPPAAERQR
jgi:hypothetical protein